MQSYCDFETDTVNERRFGAPADQTVATPRQSWLDRLARKLAPIPVDHAPIAPAPLDAPQGAGRSHPQPACCVNHAA